MLTFKTSRLVTIDCIELTTKIEDIFGQGVELTYKFGKTQEQKPRNVFVVNTFSYFEITPDFQKVEPFTYETVFELIGTKEDFEQAKLELFINMAQIGFSHAQAIYWQKTNLIIPDQDFSKSALQIAHKKSMFSF